MHEWLICLEALPLWYSETRTSLIWGNTKPVSYETILTVILPSKNLAHSKVGYIPWLNAPVKFEIYHYYLIRRTFHTLQKSLIVESGPTRLKMLLDCFYSHSKIDVDEYVFYQFVRFVVWERGYVDSDSLWIFNGKMVIALHHNIYWFSKSQLYLSPISQVTDDSHFNRGDMTSISLIVLPFSKPYLI